STWPMPTACSVPSSACITRASSLAPASAWRSCSASSTATTAGSGCTPSRATVRPSFSISRSLNMSNANKVILLVADNPDVVELTLRAFKRSHLMNPIVVARDGIEALDFLFARGPHAERANAPLPTLAILDLTLPTLDGLGVLKAIRADQRTALLPVVILTSSKEEQDMISGYSLGANSYVRKPVDFTEFLEAVKVLGIYWLMINETPPQRVTTQ